ncbi:hypothetical protein C8F01DRAFT_1099730 [Mycena amicta]|nr:hypothetical protein C8F01DRAFT_1099730 [Mycena amicta]
MFFSGTLQHSPYTSSNDSQSPVSQPRSSPSSRRSHFSSASNSSSFVASLPTAYSTFSMSTASPARKRARNLSERDADASLPWECNLAYAVVHTSDCSTCRAFKAHVSDAKSSSNTIHRALEDRDKKLDVYFSDGVEEGRRHQRAEDDARIHELEAARVDAQVLVTRLRAEARETITQLGQAQSQLRLAQAECDALRKRVQELLTMPIHFAPPSKPDSGSRLAETEHRPTPHLPQRPTSEVIASSSHHSARMPKTLRQLQLLMSKAHQPGNEESLARVKILCTDAHQTPRDRKTDMQRYILANWRNPDPVGTSSSSFKPPLLLGPNHSVQAHGPPNMSDPTEIWHAYLTVHPGSWPRGVRREADGAPHFDDLKASRTVARLRPALGPDGDATMRNEWMTCAVGMFAAPGMYADLLRREGLVVAPSNMAARGAANVSGMDMIRAEDVARHFAEAGITVIEAERELEPWAREYQAAVVHPNNKNNNGDGRQHQRSSTSKGTGNNHTRAQSSSHHKTNNAPLHSRTKGPLRSYDREQEERFGWR